MTRHRVATVAGADAFTVAVALAITLVCAQGAFSARAGDVESDAPTAPRQTHKLDRSGHAKVGKASLYGRHKSGKTMADGTPMKPEGDNAASKTLPLGTKALVTNLETGRSAVVTIRDRGPYVKGRIVDLSPATARKIGIEPKQGVAAVKVAPLTIPPAP